MTVIAFDGRTVAADKRSNDNGSIRTVTKLHRLFNDDGTIKAVLAVNGFADHGMELVAWYKAGANPETYPHGKRGSEMYTFLQVFRPGKRVIEYQCGPVPIVFEDEKFAGGSGRNAAMGALLAGCSAIEAVKIASQVDAACGNGVDFVELYDDAPGSGGTGASAPGEAASA